MIEIEKERLIRRTGALMLTTVLCFSMFSAAASAEKHVKEQEIPQQSQSAESKSPWKTKGKKDAKQPETAVEEAASAEKNVSEVDNDKLIGANTKKGPTSETVSAGKEVQALTLPVSVGETVVFTASLATGQETRPLSGDRPGAAETPTAKTEEVASSSGKKNSDEEAKKTADGAMEVFLFIQIQAEAKTDTADKEASKKDSLKEGAATDNEKKNDKSHPARETADEPETEALTYIWKVDKNDGRGWTEIPNDNSKSCTLSEISKDQNGWKYKCVIATDTGSAESDIVMLDVSESKAA